MIPPLALLPVTAWVTVHAGLYGTAAIVGGFTGVMMSVGRRLWRHW